MSRLIFVVVLFFFGKAAFAQEAPDLKHVIKSNLFFALAGEMNLAYERVFSPAISLELQGGYFIADFVEPPIGGTSLILPYAVDGFATRIAVKKYFKKTAPLGGYIAGQGMFKRITADSLTSVSDFSVEHYNLAKQVIGIKLLFGKQLSFRQSSLLFDFYAGIGVKRQLSFENVYLLEQWNDGIRSYSSYYRNNRRYVPSIHAGIVIGLGF